jgi:predicted outer membrane repeat protein
MPNLIAAGQTIFVDADASGSNDGSSWTDAFNYLQDGLAAASGGHEIRVAQGVYKPDQGTAVTSGDPGATFQLKNGVTIKGGYAGFGQPNPDARNIEAYETILSGDLAGNDVPVANPADLLIEPTRAENSYHVVTGSGTDATAVLDGFTVTAGNATGDPATHPYYGGGGVYIDTGSPTLQSCTIVGNSSGYYAGGMLNIDSSPMLTNCAFSANAAERWGAGMSNSNSSPTLTNCTLSGNMTGYWGSGAAMSNVDSDPLLVNCLINGNIAGFYGGAVFTKGGTPSLINCTCSGNSARYGGVIYNWGPGEPVLVNCILWDNAVWQIVGSAAVTYSDVEDGWPGVGNIDSDPLFVDAKGVDSLAGTEDDNLRLLGGSPCLDAADNTAVPPSVSTDLDGNPRFTDDPATPDTGKGTPPIVDMGAYEGPNSGLLLSTKSLAVPEGGTATFTVALAADPLGTVDVAVAQYSGDTDITVASGALLTFNSSNYWHPQTVTLAAAEDGDHFNGDALIEVSSLGLATVMLEAVESDNDHIVYVDAGATGADNGISWEDAFIDLQDGLAVAAAAVDVVDEVRVAQGVYMPAGPLGDRLATFQLINGVALKGGYAGSGAYHPEARNIALYETILSGDLNGNDGPSYMHNQENSYNVVTGSGTVASAMLDGFTIIGGNANGPWPHDSGGGMLNFDGSPTVSRCTFRNNAASNGGGAMKNAGGSPTVNRCMFRNNWAVLYGGAIYNSLDSNASLTDCVLKNNRAGFDGGAVYNSYDSSASFMNCLFNGNSAGFSGGAISNSLASLKLINCTLAGNSAPHGNALACDSYEQLDPSDLRIANCIIWEDDDQIWNNDASTIVITYSDVRGGWPGTGNIDADPLFVQNPHSSVDLHLRACSPCIDAGDNTAVPAPVVTDLDGNPRFVDDPATADTGNGTPPIVDMGAYEFQPVGHAPIADAGEGQIVYAWINGSAEVTLDGSGSTDPDGDALTYAWTWTIGGDASAATGVKPTIELPVGQHTITLTVNDGTQDSAPDQVVITVIEPIEGRLWAYPRVIKRGDTIMPYIVTLLCLPNVSEDQVDGSKALLLYPGGSKATYQYVFEDGGYDPPRASIVAFFDAGKLLDAVPENGTVRLHIVGQLKTGQYFYGAYWVKIID